MQQRPRSQRGGTEAAETEVARLSERLALARDELGECMSPREFVLDDDEPVRLLPLPLRESGIRQIGHELLTRSHRRRHGSW
mmetsp:Transcript_17135/g.37286  ORF Transcript_17135/g.37286 Transcript_17135/m.37286 type:complete len:82 (-) Transcript_17135:372-617(-)